MGYCLFHVQVLFIINDLPNVSVMETKLLFIININGYEIYYVLQKYVYCGFVF